MAKCITGKDLDIIKKLIDAGIVPDNTRKIMIEVDYTSLVRLTYETYADKRLLNIDWLKHLKKIMIPRDRRKGFAWLRR